jgi:hypothetical protein
MDMQPQPQSFVALRALREQPGADQAALAPQEHRAFAREWTQENPLVAVPSLLAATPLYAAAKALGFMHGRTKPTLHQVGQGYMGIYDGLKALSQN